jgi:hypothetical protein
MINMGRRLVIAVSLVSIMLKNNDLIFSTVGFLVATLKHYSYSLRHKHGYYVQYQDRDFSWMCVCCTFSSA